MAPRGPKRCPKKIARRELQWDPCLRTEAASGELAKGRLSDGCFPLGNARFAVCGFRSPTATEYFERNYQSNASHPLSATPLSHASTIMLHLVGWITVVHINFVSWVHIFSDDVRHRVACATRAFLWGPQSRRPKMPPRGCWDGPKGPKTAQEASQTAQKGFNISLRDAQMEGNAVMQEPLC